MVFIDRVRNSRMEMAQKYQLDIDFRGIKLQIFDAENFEKLRFLMENWLFFGVLSENSAKF